MKKLTDLEQHVLIELKHKYYLLEQKRESNIDRYILPVESKMETLRLKIDKIELD